MTTPLLAAVLGAWLAAPGPADTRHTTEPDTGIETWEIAAQGVSLRLSQVLPDQVRAFYLGRGFDADSAELLATTACVFQTVFRNESAVHGIAFNLADWRARTPQGEQPPKLEREWQREWERRGVPAGARTAFRYALFPTEHRYEVGDWNMGMTTYALPPGSRFDLKFVWREGDKPREVVMTGVRCATDTINK